MADQPEFEDWQTEAQKITEQITTAPVLVLPADNNEQPLEQPTEIKEKIKPVDPKKQLQDKIKRYKDITQDNYEQYFEEIKKDSSNAEIKVSNQILKNDKDFSMFGKLVAKRFIDLATEQQIDTLDQNQMLTFIDETLFLLYNQLESKNIHLVKDKLIIAKGERKKVEKEEKKKQEAEQRRKREQKALDEKNELLKKDEKKVEDDIFGGATLITSKQLQDELKNKEVKGVQVSKKPQSDDDDFM